MFSNSIETTIIFVAIALWFAHGWYLNEKLKLVHEKLDQITENFNGLREYLYEIDSQFDDERESTEAFESDESMFAGMNAMELIKQKERDGKRTLNTPFIQRS